MKTKKLFQVMLIVLAAVMLFTVCSAKQLRAFRSAYRLLGSSIGQRGGHCNPSILSERKRHYNHL